MQNTLMISGVECKTITIDGKWNVIIEGKPQIIYREKVKNKSKKNGMDYIYKLKGICIVCRKEFFGLLSSSRKYCSHSCSSKINGKLNIKFLWGKFISLSDDKELKRKARNFITNAITAGKIIRSKVCSHCGSSCIPDFHHPDYIKFNEGMWLCHSCHFKLEFGHKDIKGELIAYNI